MTMLKIFGDFHHSGAAQAQALLFQRRLGHALHFPNTDFVVGILNQGWCTASDMMACAPGWLNSMGGYPQMASRDAYFPMGLEEFMSTSWDVWLVTRIETQRMFQELRKLHPSGNRVKIIGLTGNDNTPFDWPNIPNLMTSDYATFRNSPADIHKIWYSQEIGQHYYSEPFTPINRCSLKVVNQFVNCFPSMRGPWYERYDMSNWRSQCPYCQADQNGAPMGRKIDPYGIWCGAKDRLPDHQFEEYGINCTHGCINETEMPKAYDSGAVTVHFKCYDGYGFSMLQSIVRGRPVIVPRGFHKFRTAGKYLIPNLTCFEADWNSASLAEVIQYVTGSEGRANMYATACWRAARGLFDWGLEAFRVSEFMEDLR